MGNTVNDKRKTVVVEFLTGHNGTYCSCGTDVAAGIYTLTVPDHYEASEIRAEDLTHDDQVCMAREGASS